MEGYSCVVCKKFKTDNTFEYIDHISNHDELDKLDLTNDLNKMKKQKECCNYCRKEISDYYNFQKHKNTCVWNKFLSFIDEIQKTEIIDEISKKCSERKKEISICSMRDIKNNSIEGDQNQIQAVAGIQNQVNNNNNKNQIVIHMNNFGKENLQMLDPNINANIKDELLKTLGSYPRNHKIHAMRRFSNDNIKKTFIKVFEEVYFNNKYPENHNIYVSTKVHERPFHIFLNDRWENTGDTSSMIDVILRIKKIFEEWIIEIFNEVNSECIDNEDYDQYDLNIEFVETLTNDLDLFTQCLAQKQYNISSVKDMTKLFRDIAYKNRRVVEPTYKQTLGAPNRKKQLMLTKKNEDQEVMRIGKTKLRIKGMY